jgi:hypothetical protein
LVKTKINPIDKITKQNDPEDQNQNLSNPIRSIDRNEKNKT